MTAETPWEATAHMDRVESRLDGRELALFLDYDGTLTPIVEDPDEAVLTDEMRNLLRELDELCTLAIVSGRDRPDVEGKVALDQLVYAGSHGFDVNGPSVHMQHEAARARLSDLDAAENALRDRLGDVPGSKVERKRYAIAVHYRQVREEADVERLERAVRAVHAEHPSLQRMDGKKIVELRPDVQWDKGRAVGFLLEALGVDPKRSLAVYIGDDTTDEDAFAYLEEHGDGLGILVGEPERPTKADCFLQDTDAVQDFLARLRDRLRGGK